ncbi:MAG: peptidoglycan DD-metalloendopeptidase family protein [Gammaproteobacteria bacterium]|nr:peptidoglycan DD-metalloendopeptidase family protein [Gammaproteobacteria bacterium]
MDGGGVAWPSKARRPARPVLLLLMVAALAAAPSLAGAGPQEVQADKEAELRLVKERIQTLNRRLKEMRGAKTRTEQELEEHDRRVARLAREGGHTERQVEATRRRLAALREQQSELQARDRAQTAALARQIRSAFIMSRQNAVKLMLNQNDPAAVQRALTYHDYINREYRTAIETVRRRLAELAAVARRIGEEEARLATLHRQLEQERRQLEAEQHRRRELLRTLTRDIASRGQELAHLNSNRRELERLIEELGQALADIAPMPERERAFATLRGQLPWPYGGRTVYRYGSARGIGNLRWQGVVLAGRPGEPVRAIHHGRVAFADWLRGFGLLIILDHGDGYMSLYGHNQTLIKETGDWVDSGEAVATVGASGGIERPGVYFEIRKNATPLDPAAWCRS